MRQLVLDGSALPSAKAVYRQLAEAFQLAPYFGNNPDALWDGLSDYHGAPVEVIWRDAALSAERLGNEFGKIVAVLEKAALDGRLKLRLA